MLGMGGDAVTGTQPVYASVPASHPIHSPSAIQSHMLAQRQQADQMPQASAFPSTSGEMIPPPLDNSSFGVHGGMVGSSMAIESHPTAIGHYSSTD